MTPAPPSKKVVSTFPGNYTDLYISHDFVTFLYSSVSNCRPSHFPILLSIFFGVRFGIRRTVPTTKRFGLRCLKDLTHDARCTPPKDLAHDVWKIWSTTLDARHRKVWSTTFNANKLITHRTYYYLLVKKISTYHHQHVLVLLTITYICWF